MMAQLIALLDVLRIGSLSLLSMIFHPKRLRKRSWLTEFVFRLAKRLLSESATQSFEWLRQRENVLKMYSLTMRKVRYEDVTINGVPCQWCRPKSQKSSRTIIYFHGGGYVIGSANGFQNMMAILATETLSNVLCVDYRLAPEHKLPAAQDDALAVTEYWLRQYPGDEVIIAGDSAGGGLCVATCLELARQNLETLPAACVLISPWVAPNDSTGSMVINEENDILDRKILSRWIETYLDGQSPTDHRINFCDVDLSSLPPVYIQAASAEILIDQINRFAQRLLDSNVPVELKVFDDLFHDFQILGPLVPDAKKAIIMIDNYLRSL